MVLYTPISSHVLVPYSYSPLFTSYSCSLSLSRSILPLKFVRTTGSLYGFLCIFAHLKLFLTKQRQRFDASSKRYILHHPSPEPIRANIFNSYLVSCHILIHLFSSCIHVLPLARPPLRLLVSAGGGLGLSSRLAPLLVALMLISGPHCGLGPLASVDCLRLRPANPLLERPILPAFNIVPWSCFYYVPSSHSVFTYILG